MRQGRKYKRHLKKIKQKKNQALKIALNLIFLIILFFVVFFPSQIYASTELQSSNPETSLTASSEISSSQPQETTISKTGESAEPNPSQDTETQNLTTSDTETVLTEESETELFQPEEAAAEEVQQPIAEEESSLIDGQNDTKEATSAAKNSSPSPDPTSEKKDQASQSSDSASTTVQTESANESVSKLDPNQDQETTTSFSLEDETLSSEITQEMQTGEAVSDVNNQTLINASLINSRLDLLVEELTSQEVLNLYLYWYENNLKNQNQITVSFDEFLLEILNKGEVGIISEAQANTGQNQQQGAGTAVMTTGDAIAIANLLVLQNITLVDSQVVLGVINILNSGQGGVIFPRPELITGSASSTSSSTLLAQIINEANINNTSQAQANTGQNQQQAQESQLKTGQAIALSQAYSLVNLVNINNNYYLIVINNAGLWQGQILGWEGPGSVINPVLGSQSLSGQIASGDQTTSGELNFNLTSQADLQALAQAQANTGQNQQQAEFAFMTTGDAIAIANSLVMANSTILNSNVWLIFVNIASDWQGNLEFAYPDLQVSLTGEQMLTKNKQTSWQVEVNNLGSAYAHDVVVNLSLPDEISGILSSLTPTVIKDNNLSWHLGTLAPKQSLSWSLSGLVSALVQDNSLLKTIVSIFNQDPELTGNNKSFLLQQVKAEEKTLTSSYERQDQNPDIRLAVSSNVAEFVFLADTIRLKIQVKNQGGPSYQTVLTTVLKNSLGEVIGGGSLDLGQLQSGQELWLTFNMKLPSMGPAGFYTLTVFTSSKNQKEVEFQSPSAQTTFLVKGKSNFAQEVLVQSALASNFIPAGNGVVLGQSLNSTTSQQGVLTLIPLLILRVLTARLKKYLDN